MKKVDLEMLERFDPEIADLLKKEEERQRTVIGLIASENVASVLSTCLEGSAFTNKNTEGYPGRRFTGGCEYADAVEQLAVKRLKELFGCEHANLQSGNATIANVAVLLGLLETGDTVLSMNLNDGGHLSHGARFHISGKLFNIIHYGVSEKNELIDMDNVRRLANEYKPKMIVCGASSYPRLIDYKTFKDIAKSIGAYLWVDSAHDIGLVAAGVIPSPVPYADIVTFSTQKTLRGPRGCGVILCKKEIGSKIDRGVFPMLQGGPKADMIAARAVLFKECMADEFKKYGKQVLLNAKALAKGCSDEGIRLVTGGTDTHMVLLDVTSLIPTGQEAENVLNSIGIVTNKNMIPFDKLPPSVTSGLRIGSPIMTTRGAKENTMYEIGRLIGKTLKNHKNEAVLDQIRKETRRIADSFPMFSDEWLPKECK
mgnify:CR=1 FL=1|jgi:glycine hydroxymethyltransferase